VVSEKSKVLILCSN